jgi:MoaA/NifB/PqqE/SkfB family radical SAM enzyme
MHQLPENFCIAPFVQLTTHPTGSMSPCPYLGGTTWAGQNSPRILDKWASIDLEKLRASFINNERNAICQRCWHEELNNKQSLRQRLYNPITGTSDYSVVNNTTLVSDLAADLTSKSYLQGPKVLTVKNGNLCNAKCRSCHPGDSSRWIEDSRKLVNHLGKQHYRIDQTESNWSDQQIDEIFELSKNLHRLELFGGEPLYNKKVRTLLERIAVAGHSQQLNLYINTNGSVDLVKQIPLIKEFKEIEIGVSIDDIGDRFEYLRHGVKFDQLVNNVRSWQNYFDQHGVKYYIDSITTVSVFNILYLPEIKKFVQSLLPQAPFWNLLVHPDYLFIKNMPDHIKAAAVQKLSNDIEFDDLINVMQQPADIPFDKFLSITNALDIIRSENFQQTFPELANLIDNC